VIRCAWVCALWAAAPLGVAFLVFRRRDVSGE
jgi:ABC-type transport system involved in multi-copper enzyme maturation permease subunit